MSVREVLGGLQVFDAHGLLGLHDPLLQVLLALGLALPDELYLRSKPSVRRETHGMCQAQPQVPFFLVGFEGKREGKPRFGGVH